MRIVADTNTVISGTLWAGPPRLLLSALATADIELYSSPVLIGELRDVLARPKFAARLQAVGRTADEIVSAFSDLLTLIVPPPIPPTVIADRDDDHVLACATAADADLIVSGDRHLLDLRTYGRTQIVSAAEAVAVLGL